MKNVLLLAVAIIAAALIAQRPPNAAGPQPQIGRYQIGAGGTGSYVRIDTATGDAWFVKDQRWVPFPDNGARP